MNPELSIEPPLSGGKFCAGQPYTLTALCPDAVLAEFSAVTGPTNVNLTTVKFSAQNNLVTTVIFPETGIYGIQVDCLELA